MCGSCRAGVGIGRWPGRGPPAQMAHPVGRAKKTRKPTPSPPPARPWRVARPAARGLLTLVGVIGVLAVVGWLGNEAFRRIGPRDRYRTRVADIVCESPPDTARSTFLAEVRYVGNLPDTFNTFDPADQERVSAAFAGHPWVETVDEWRVEPANVVRVGLTFRTAVLAAKVTDGAVRLVDASGVLLPVTGVPPGIAELVTPVPEPLTAAGQVWADSIIRRAIELVKAYQPTRLEKTPAGWRLTQPDGKVLVVR